MTLDLLMRRIAIYAGATLSVIALSAVTVKTAQREVRDDINDLRSDVRQVRDDVRYRTVVDSIRFERIMGVMELAVTALVEPQGSPEKSTAVSELRRLRRLAP